MRHGRSLLLAIAALFGAVTVYSSVVIVRTPHSGLQPQAAIDRAGNLHLIYYRGEASAGDIYYCRQASGANEFTRPVRVNSESGSAIAAGTIRGAQLAVGAGRVHVAWNGHAPKNGSYMEAPMLYSRSNEEGTGFERERNLITFARGLDGGGSVVADERGNVFVFWHAPMPGNTNGEPGRALYVTKSLDGGQTFRREALATSEATGACGCCGMKAFADTEGNLFALFRGATDMVNRDEILLGGKAGEELKPLLKHPWKIGMCPMSSASFAHAGGVTFAAWESQDNVFYSRIIDLSPGTPSSPPGAAKRKHPALAANAKGELLLTWTEGTGWGRGGSVAWQLYDANGRPAGAVSRAEGLPAWSLPSAVAKPDGNFLLFY